MKFAHTYIESLANDDFPEEWQAAAIQYRQLKKCIKRVQGELAELGLTVETLKVLLSEHQQESADGVPVMKYMFDGGWVALSAGICER